MAQNEYAGNHLQHLKGSDYEIADGQPDIRGWDVKDANDKKIGKVKELLFDNQSLKVRYMIVDTNHNDFDLKDRKVLIPIGLGELHEKGDDVILPGVTAAQLESLPDYNDKTTTEDENKIRNVFAGVGSAGLAAAALTAAGRDENFYDHQHFDEDNLYKRRKGLLADEAVTDNSTLTGDTTVPVIEENLEVGKRTVQTGGAYIRSRIVEKPVTETVNLQEERVYVERNPVDRPAANTDFDTFKEGVIELAEHAEVPVVNKEARVVEEITVNKDVTEHSETVRDTVRKTEVDIEDLKDNSSGTTSYRSAESEGI